jgi:hypothetical protein
MGFASRTGFATRAFAVFVAAYCVLASGRALVPGLCATLAELDATAAVANCHTPKHSCCEGGAAHDCVEITTAPHPCAFCALVHAPGRVEALPAFPLPAIGTPQYLAAHDFYVPDSTGAEAYTLRGPPIS